MSQLQPHGHLSRAFLRFKRKAWVQGAYRIYWTCKLLDLIYFCILQVFALHVLLTPHVHKSSVLLIGDLDVGRTQLLGTYVGDSYDSDVPVSPVSTIGFDFKIKTIRISDATVRLQVWNTGRKLTQVL